MAKRVDVGGMNDTATANALTATATFAGASPGDAAVVYAGINTATDTCTTPSGWVLILGPFTQSSNVRGYIFGKTALTSTEISGGVAFTWTTSGRLTGSGMVLVGSVKGFGTAVQAGAAASSLTNPAYTTVGAFNDCLIFSHTRIATASTHAVATFPGTWTKGSERATNFGTSPNFSSACGILATPVASGTAIGGGSTTTSPAATQVVGVIVELLAYPANVGSASASSGAGGVAANGTAAAGSASANTGAGGVAANGTAAAGSAMASTGAAGAATAATVASATASAATMAGGTVPVGATVSTGAAQALSGASGAGSARTVGSGSGSATSTSSATGKVNTVGSGSGAAKATAGGVSAGRVVAAGSGSASSTSAGAAAVRVVAVGSGAALTLASGAATIVPGSTEIDAASATASAAGVAHILTSPSSSAAGKSSAGGVVSPMLVVAAGSATATTTAGGVVSPISSPAVGLARAASSAYGGALVITTAVAAAAARADAYAIGSTIPPRDLKLSVVQLGARWSATGPADRWSARVLDETTIRFLEDT